MQFTKIKIKIHNIKFNLKFLQEIRVKKTNKIV